jgi:citrate lyase synthetase
MLGEIGCRTFMVYIADSLHHTSRYVSKSLWSRATAKNTRVSV